MTPLLWRALLRHPLQHPWQLGLAILGIALGVAVVLAVDLANASARRSFELSMRRITGAATHRIVGGSQAIPETLYARLRVERNLRQSTPVVTGYLPDADQPGQLLQILGIDPFAEGPFRLPATDIATNDFDFRALLLQADAALLPEGVGQQITLRRGTRHFTLKRVGTLQGTDLAGLIVTDISTAQIVLGQPGKLNYIDLILPDGPDGERLAQELQSELPSDLRLENSERRNRTTQDLSAAFSLNLNAMSFLALMVGMFLIYNAMTFAVVQRRRLLGTLRALGVARRELFAGVLSEALLLGLIGVFFGVLLGLWLGSGLVHLVTRTINDLYYIISVRDFFIDPWSLVKSIALGLAATLAAAWLPAREAANIPAAAALSRSHLETRWQAVLPRLALAGLLLLASGGGVVALSHSLIAGFIGLFLLIFGCALITPPAVVALVHLNQPLCQRLGLLARMANRDIARHLSRTGIAAAALMIAFAATVGVGIMVDSFRGGVSLWIKDLLNADLYIAPPTIPGGSTETLQPQVLAALHDTPGIAGVSLYRRSIVELDGRPIQLMAVALAPLSQAGYRLIDGDPTETWQTFQTGESILISEPLAYRQGLRAGDSLTLPTAGGLRAFPIVGVFLDYGSEHGRILLHRSAYQRYWQDSSVSSAAIYAESETSLSALRERLQQRLGTIQPLMIRPNRDIQELTLDIFDRTFTITNVLRLLAVLIALVGTLSALLALQLERAREFAVLRATGMTVREVGGLVSLQTGFMGAAAGLFALPTGLMMAFVLIFVINRRAFGWSLPFQVSSLLLLETVALAIAAALLAGLYPIWRMAGTPPADALRSE